MTLRLSNPMSAAVWLAFFVPASLFGGWADRSFGAALFLLGGAALLAKPSPWEARKPAALALRIFLLLELLYVVSFAYSAAFNGALFGLRDYLELPRYVFLGVFAAYLIRHYDAQIRGVMEWAMTAALYFSLLLPAADAQGYVAVMTLCWLLFFSRLRLRYLHALTAAVVVVLNGGPAAWTAAFWVLSTALSLRVYRGLHRKRARFSLRFSVALFAALLASPIVYIRSSSAASAELGASRESVTRQLIRRSPVFGWGPTDVAALPGRSQYLFWELKGGALGAGLILAAIALAGYRLLRAASGDPASLSGAAAFLGSVALMLAAGRYLESYLLFFLTALFMAGMFEASQ
jgi:hypothetical protein